MQHGQHRRREVVVDTVQVRHVGREDLEQLAQLVLGLEGIDGLGRLDQLVLDAVRVAELQLLHEVLAPARGHVLRVVHGHDGRFPAEFLEERVMFQVDDVGPTTAIVVGVQGKKAGGCRFHEAAIL